MTDLEIKQKEVELRYLRNMITNSAARIEQLLNEAGKVLADVSDAVSVYTKTWSHEPSPEVKD